jgi:hypothetical protein
LMTHLSLSMRGSCISLNSLIKFSYTYFSRKFYRMFFGYTQPCSWNRFTAFQTHASKYLVHYPTFQRVTRLKTRPRLSCLVYWRFTATQPAHDHHSFDPVRTPGP